MDAAAGRIRGLGPEAEAKVQTVDDESWDVDQAAAFLGIKPKTLYRLAGEGTVPSFKVGGARRFAPSKLRAWRDGQQGGGK